MPVTYVQSKSAILNGNSTVLTVSATFAAPVTAGNLLVGFLWSNSGQTPTFGDDLNGSDAWTIAGVVESGTYLVSRICFFPNTVGGSCTVTATWASTRQRVGLIVAEYSGIATASPLDVTAHSSLVGGSTTPTSTAATTTVANDLVVAGLVCDYVTVITAGTSISFTTREIGDDAVATSAAFEDGVKATAGSVEGNWTLNTAADWAVCMAAFQAAAVQSGSIIFISG